MSLSILKQGFLQSIQGRLSLASLLILPVVCGALAWALDRAYSASMLESQARQMTTQAYALIAAAELESDSLWLPEYVTDDQLNQPSSDHYAVVFDERTRKSVWRSLSSLARIEPDQISLSSLTLGKPLFSESSYDGKPLFVLHYMIEWEEGNRLLPFRFIVLASTEGYQQALAEYRQTIWLWLSAIALLLVILQFAVLKWGLRPVSSMIDDLALIQRGESARLDGDYPHELKGMSDSINRLLVHEAHQKERYRNTLADLAHSIKNPAAIIASSLASAKRNLEERGDQDYPWLHDIEEQNQRIDQILSYQLTRAVGGAATPFSKALSIAPVCEKVCSAMNKVYHDKAIQLRVEVSEDAVFRGDEGDLMELLGNLIDNAYKYGRSQVHIASSSGSDELKLTIEDDGPGMPESERANLIRRGQRADTTIPGQGIGLSVVNDIVDSYAGELKLLSSPLGGLRVELSFHWGG